MYSPPGAARAYVRALLESDTATLSEQGTVTADARSQVAAAIDRALLAEVADIRTEGRTKRDNRILTQPVTIESADGATVILDVEINLDTLKVVGVAIQ